jgi:peptidoglycan-associated lipoprotein
MKRATFLNLLMASAVLASAVGCKKQPKNITHIPGGARGVGDPSQTGTPILPGGGRTFNPNDATGAGLGTDPNAIPAGLENASEDHATLAPQTIYFDFDRSAIKPSEQGKLEQVATYMKNTPGVQLRVDGHCDERGTEEYNRSLGERRAIAAREFLIQKHGVESGRITTTSWGEDKPVSLERTEEAYARNRRGEFVILRPQ